MLDSFLDRQPSPESSVWPVICASSDLPRGRRQAGRATTNVRRSPSTKLGYARSVHDQGFPPPRAPYPLGIRLHQAVFDAVVHHLRVMTSTDRTVDKAVCSLTVGARRASKIGIAFSTSSSDRPPSGRSRSHGPRYRNTAVEKSIPRAPRSSAWTASSV